MRRTCPREPAAFGAAVPLRKQSAQREPKQLGGIGTPLSHCKACTPLVPCSLGGAAEGEGAARADSYNGTVVNAHQLSRACRVPGYSPPGPGDPEPPAFMVVPTTCARAAVRSHHTNGAAPAKAYLAGSRVGAWAGSANPSLASNAQAVLDGFDWYVNSDSADGRPMHGLDAQTPISLPTGSVDARLDVVLKDGADLAGRVVLWDGPDFNAATASTIACAFALALTALYPGRVITTVGIWQARRQRKVEVPLATALAQTAAAGAVLAAM